MLPLHVRHDVVEGDRLHLEADGGEELPSDGQTVHQDGGAPEHHQPLTPGHLGARGAPQHVAHRVRRELLGHKVRGEGERGEGEVPGAEEGGVGGGAEQLLLTLVVGMRKEG